MDHENPARTALTAIPPAMLADMVQDPKLLKNIAIPMVAMQLDKLHRMSLSPSTPVGQLIQIADFTAKMADVYPKATAPQATGSGERFSVNIVLNQPEKKGVVVDVASVEVADAKV